MGDDLDLARLVGDGAAFREWYDVTAPRVYAYLFARIGSLTLAEDLTQETFIEVVRRPQTFDGREDAVPWLIGIARHRLARYFSRRGHGCRCRPAPTDRSCVRSARSQA